MNVEITATSEPDNQAIAGEQYDLQCSLLGLNQAMVSITSEFQWIGPSNNIILMGPQNEITISMTDLGKKLQFHRLNNSTHSGNYICQVTISGDTTTTVTVNASYHLQITCKKCILLYRQSVYMCMIYLYIHVQHPVSAHIRRLGYRLTCSVTGITFNPIIHYQWVKNNDSERDIKVGMNSNTHDFDPLKPSDAGVYACHVAVSSQYFDGQINETSHKVRIMITRK